MSNKRVTGEAFAAAALNPELLGIPYDKLDCQAFVERVLSDCGIKRNWRGSNHMWREALTWRGTVDECIELWGEVPVGAWLFTVKNDGGEKKRGYNDNDGNAAHVGIYTGDGNARHSTTGGVQDCDFPASRWTHVGLAEDIIYYTESPQMETDTDQLRAIRLELGNICAAIGNIMEVLNNGLDD